MRVSFIQMNKGSQPPVVLASSELAYAAQLVERLLDGLTRISRIVCRRKIPARLDRDAAVTLRLENSPDHFCNPWRSLLPWPFPADEDQSDRLKIAANMAAKALLRR